MLKKRLISIWIYYGILYVTCFAAPSPQITSEGAILMDAKTGQILYEKNSMRPFYPASATKLLSGVIFAEDMAKGEGITKIKESIMNVPSDSSHVGIQVGDVYSYEDGLRALLMGSDNFVAYDMAVKHSGSIEAFAKAMNEKARDIGMLQSSFVTPHGYHDSNHYTTPYDLALLTRYAFSNPVIEKIASTPYTTLKTVNTDRKLFIKHTAAFFHPESGYYNPYVVAAKTGYHTPAGRTLVAKANYGDLELIGVVMRTDAPNQFKDINDLFEYGSKYFKPIVAQNGTYKLKNETYSKWAESFIETAIEKDMYLPHFKSYQDLMTEYKFVSGTRRGVENIGLNFPQDKIGYVSNQKHISAEEAQIKLEKWGQYYNKYIPKTFVQNCLKSVQQTPIHSLTIEQDIYIQLKFIEYIVK